MGKKVLFVATTVKKHINVFHTPYLKWFKEQGYEVHVCARNDYESEDFCYIPYCDKFFNLPFERNPFKYNNLITLKKLKKIIKVNDYDLIHCHTPMGGVICRIAAKNAREQGTKVFYTAHGFHFYKGSPVLNWLLYYPVEKILSSRTDVLITINQEDFLNAKKFKAKRLEYVRGVGVEIPEFYGRKLSKKSKRESLNIKESDFLMVSVGELNKNKNHKTVIDALYNLKNPKIKYVICGEGPEKEYLLKHIKKLNLENQVNLVGYREDIREIYYVSDLFAFPSFREGLSLSLMEAMSCSLPVVCSKIRGNVDLIKDNEGGYLVEPNDVMGFAEAINKVYSNIIKRNKLSEYNRNIVNEYSLENILSVVGDLYRQELNITPDGISTEK